MDEIIKSRIAVGAAHHLLERLRSNDFRWHLGEAIQYGSPIEHILATALHILTCVDDVTCRVQSPPTLGSGNTLASCEKRFANGAEDCGDDPFFSMVFPQVQISRYTVDFLVLCATPRLGADTHDGFIIECDGHDFHERTKEQAAHDKRRDRELQILGWQVFRFTGSEIWHDPMSCASQILVVIKQKQRDLYELHRTTLENAIDGPRTAISSLPDDTPAQLSDGAVRPRGAFLGPSQHDGSLLTRKAVEAEVMRGFADGYDPRVPKPTNMNRSYVAGFNYGRHAYRNEGYGTGSLSDYVKSSIATFVMDGTP